MLLDLCAETDPGIRSNVLGMLFALAESPDTKRELVELGTHQALVPLTRESRPCLRWLHATRLSAPWG